jgi:hypothetical protein
MKDSVSRYATCKPTDGEPISARQVRARYTDTMSGEAIIPTAYKSKLSRGSSWPVGAEAITRGLSGAPHAESFDLSFHGEAPIRDGRYLILYANHRPIRNAGYSGARINIERGWYNEQWALVVFAVDRKLKFLANRLMREHGLGLVAKWLWDSEKTGWRSRDQRIDLLFSPEEETIVATEESGA